MGGKHNELERNDGRTEVRLTIVRPRQAGARCCRCGLGSHRAVAGNARGAVLIRRFLGAPVLFLQERAGRAGRPFTILKFRTMEMSDARCCGRPDACVGVQMAPGARMSGLGVVLRRTGLDELPQLVNILRGDMSFIGPRPLLVRYVDRYTPRQRRRLEVRPGITGWAQINGRTDLDWEDRLEQDVWYVDHRSLRLDLAIARRTFRAAASGSGYSQEGSHTGLEFLGTGVPVGICPVTEARLDGALAAGSTKAQLEGRPSPSSR